MEKAKVLVIYTGGTIGMVPADGSDPASPLKPAGPEPFLHYLANPLEGANENVMQEIRTLGLRMADDASEDTLDVRPMAIEKRSGGGGISLPKRMNQTFVVVSQRCRR